MKAQQKKLSGCASNLLAHEDLGNFEEAHHWNIQAKFYNEKFPLVYESDNIWDSLTWRLWCYFWSTSVEKEIVALSLLSFSLILLFLFFFFFFFLWPLFFLFGLSQLLLFFSHFFSFCKVRSLIPTCGGIIVSIILSSPGQCSNNEDHHTFINLQLENYNSTLRTKYDSIWMLPTVYRDMQWIKSDMYERIMNGGFATNTMSTTWSCKEQYDKSNACHMNGTVESCMAIYLGMAMEMP